MNLRETPYGVKERPMLMSAPMVRAILDGRKTMTRRVVKPQPDWLHPGPCYSVTPEGWQGPLDYSLWAHESDRDDGDARRCPYGQPGDRLWVRETWMPDPPRDGTWPDTVYDGCKPHDKDLIPERFRLPEHCLYRSTWTGDTIVGWTPGIHMPRWASRITLEITAVGVERLNDISEQDAKAEGLHQYSYFWQDAEQPLPDVAYEPAPGWPTRYSDPIQAFRSLWESINGTGSWALNPWVWVIEFRWMTT